MKQFLNWLALLCQIIGTLAIALEANRFNARLPKKGFTLGEQPGYQAWFYHCGLYGVYLVLAGFVLQGVALALDP